MTAAHNLWFIGLTHTHTHFNVWNNFKIEEFSIKMYIFLIFPLPLYPNISQFPLSQLFNFHFPNYPLSQIYLFLTPLLPIIHSSLFIIFPKSTFPKIHFSQYVYFLYPCSKILYFSVHTISLNFLTFAMCQYVGKIDIFLFLSYY